MAVSSSHIKGSLYSIITLPVMPEPMLVTFNAVVGRGLVYQTTGLRIILNTQTNRLRLALTFPSPSLLAFLAWYLAC